jgi:hypothetical protein
MKTKPETRLVQEAANGQLRRRVGATNAAHVLASPNGGKAIHKNSLCRPLHPVRGPLAFSFVEPKLTGDEPMTVARRSCGSRRKVISSLADGLKVDVTFLFRKRADDVH